MTFPHFLFLGYRLQDLIFISNSINLAAMYILISILVLSLIIWRWSYFRLAGISRMVIVAVFLLKIAGGYLSYKYHNIYFAGGDSNIYLQGGRDLVDYSNKNPWLFINLFLNRHRNEPGWEETYNMIYWDPVKGNELFDDNRTAIRVNALVSLFSFRSVGVHIIILVFLSMIGLAALYKTFVRWFGNVFKPAVFLAVFLTPSILFWTSGILKETHTILFLGLFVFYLAAFLENKSLKNLMVSLVLFALLYLSRTFLAAAVFFPVVFLLSTLAFRKHVIPKSLLVASVLLLILFFSARFAGIDPVKVMIGKQEGFNITAVNARSYFHLPAIRNGWDILLYFPLALVNVFIQPQLFRFDTWLYVFPLIENFDIITMLLIIILKYYRKPDKKALKFWLFIAMVWIIGGWIIGLTVPVQGAIARYKSVLMPFLLMSIFSIADWEKIKKKYIET